MLIVKKNEIEALPSGLFYWIEKSRWPRRATICFFFVNFFGFLEGYVTWLDRGAILVLKVVQPSRSSIFSERRNLSSGISFWISETMYTPPFNSESDRLRNLLHRYLTQFPCLGSVLTNYFVIPSLKWRDVKGIWFSEEGHSWFFVPWKKSQFWGPLFTFQNLSRPPLSQSHQKRGNVVYPDCCLSTIPKTF